MVSFNSVLIVDDDPIQVALLTSYFTSLGVKVVKGIDDAAVALSFLQSVNTHFDLIVSDLQMPNMDGLEFMRNVKELNFNGKFALVSGLKGDLLSHASRLAKMHSLNLIGQIPKPLTRVALDAVFLKVDDKVPDKSSEGERAVITQDAFSTAIRQNEICAYYQPKVCVKSGAIRGAEALARWVKPDGSTVSPTDFVAFATNAGRLNELTFHLFESVLKDIPDLVKYQEALNVAINLDPVNINTRALPDQINDLMKLYNVSAKNISFEVTESSILNLNVTTLEVLSRLRMFDFEIAIDDFGTGSSNIQTLRDFPYSELKIDKSFISNAVNNSFSRETVQAAVKLAREQGMKIVAEGVEDFPTWQMVQELCIDEAQGFLLSRAMPKKDFAEFLHTNRNGLRLRAA